MSLQVWLPLNGNLNNQGLSDITITNNGAAVNNNGKIGKCYNFNGTDNNLSFNYFVSGTDISFCCWAQFNQFPTHLIDARTAASTGYQPMYITATAIQIGTNGASPNISYKFSTGQWYHICVTYNSQKSSAYVNGELVGSTTSAKGTDFNTTLPIYIGSRFNATSWLNGSVNDLRIYNHCLSQKEVKEISKALILYYPFTDSYKDGIYDCGITNSYDGKIAGTITVQADSPRHTNSYNFASGAYIGLDSTPFNTQMNDFTFSFWMKTSEPNTIACLWNGRTSVDGPISIFKYTNGNFRFDDGSQKTFTSYTIPSGVWHHYVFTRDSSYVKLYVDGTLIETKTSTAFTTVGAKGTIGASSTDSSTGSGNNFVGNLSDYRIYATTLSAADVLELYQTSVIIDNANNTYAYEFIEE